MNSIPIISKLIEHEGLCYALNADDKVIFITEYREIAELYYAVPAIVNRQADKIATLTRHLKAIEDAYNHIVMRMVRCGSNLFH